MFYNYLKIALRNLLKYEAYTFVNTVSLSLGIAFCLLVFLTTRELQSNLFKNPVIIIAGLTVSLVAGLLAGACPAVPLSGFKPIVVLRNRFKTGGLGLLNRGLVVNQFVLTYGVDYYFIRTAGIDLSAGRVISCPAEGVLPYAENGPYQSRGDIAA